jgi:hypothetical protein
MPEWGRSQGAPAVDGCRESAVGQRVEQRPTVDVRTPAGLGLPHGGAHGVTVFAATAGRLSPSPAPRAGDVGGHGEGHAATAGRFVPITSAMRKGMRAGVGWGGVGQAARPRQ